MRHRKKGEGRKIKESQSSSKRERERDKVRQRQRKGKKETVRVKERENLEMAPKSEMYYEEEFANTYIFDTSVPTMSVSFPVFRVRHKF